jgi:hypothetical protein
MLHGASGNTVVLGSELGLEYGLCTVVAGLLAITLTFTYLWTRAVGSPSQVQWRREMKAHIKKVNALRSNSQHASAAGVAGCTAGAAFSRSGRSLARRGDRAQLADVLMFTLTSMRTVRRMQYWCQTDQNIRKECKCGKQFRAHRLYKCILSNLWTFH